jgi:very-short-patch-repair endonuclease
MWTSKPEDDCHTLLVEIFGSENIERQAPVYKWPIDFYVSSIDTYIQLDGVYWHGLDRPIEKIAESDTHNDKAICKKWLTDREQERYFSEHGMKLIRITDLDIINRRSVIKAKFESLHQLPVDENTRKEDL